MAIEMIKRCDYCGKMEVIKEMKAEMIEPYKVDVKMFLEEKTIAIACAKVGDVCKECKERIMQNLHIEFKMTREVMNK